VGDRYSCLPLTSPVFPHAPARPSSHQSQTRSLRDLQDADVGNNDSVGTRRTAGGYRAPLIKCKTA